MSVLIEVRKTKLTKSMILQMRYIGIPKDSRAEVLGWVNIGRDRWVIVKHIGEYYRGEFVTEITTKIEGTQFPLEGGGYEFPHLTHVQCETFNRGRFNLSVDRIEEKNIEAYLIVKDYQMKTTRAGQIYY